ncbi:MAG: hypothetical protein KDD70_11880 [Bdellovibrionales bacterium]|nr:hypothetical protein [Bdellovibrionales bacterium]
MLLAYIHLENNEPQLCLLADKPDQYSRPVPVRMLPITDSAVCRLGPYEAVLTTAGEGGWIYIVPMSPSKLLLTPMQIDSPGFEISRARIRLGTEHGDITEFQQEKDIQRDEWQSWNPNKRSRL